MARPSWPQLWRQLWPPLWPPLWPSNAAGKALVGFWGLILTLGVGVAATLLWLGPPARQSPPRVEASSPLRPGSRRTITPPDPALLEASALISAGPDKAGKPVAMLPRIAADGRTPAMVYASPAAPAPAGAIRIAILLDGVGLSVSDSLDAIDRLPASVSLAVSPYTAAPETILRAARRAGHEFLLSLPMEPNRSPLDDEGGMQLSTISSDDENARHLEWSLSQIQGYAGITNQFAGLSGERYAESVDFDDIAQGLAKRGLFYINAIPGKAVPPHIDGAAADLRIAGPKDAAGLDRLFLQLENAARAKGSALLVAGPLYPVTVERLDHWSRGLAERGLTLVPVSQLVHKADANAAEPAP